MGRKCDDKEKNEQRRVIHSLGPSLLRRVDGTKLMWVVDYAGVSNIFTFRSSVPLDALLQACHPSLVSSTILVLPTLCRALTLSRRCLPNYFLFRLQKGRKKEGHAAGTVHLRCNTATSVAYRTEISYGKIRQFDVKANTATEACRLHAQPPRPDIILPSHSTQHSLRVDIVRLPY